MGAVGADTIGADPIGADPIGADPIGVVLGVPSAYGTAFEIGIELAIVLRTLGLPRDER